MTAIRKDEKRRMMIGGGGLILAGVLLLIFPLELLGFDLRTVGFAAIGMGIVLMISTQVRHVGRPPPPAHTYRPMFVLLGAFMAFLGLFIVIFSLLPVGIPLRPGRLLFGLGLGFTFLLQGILQAIHGLLLAPPEKAARSLGEKEAIASFAATLVITTYFVVAMGTVKWGEDASPATLSRIATMVIVLAVLARILKGVQRLILRMGQIPLLSGVEPSDEIHEDERDVAIHARAVQWAYGAIFVLLAALVVSIGLPNGPLLPLRSPVAIAHALIVMMMLAEIARSGFEVFLYRRDRA